MSLSPELQHLKDALLENDQGHLFVDENGRPLPHSAEERLLKYFHSLSYPGGIIEYINTSRRLIAETTGAAEDGGMHEEVVDMTLPERHVMFQFPTITEPEVYAAGKPVGSSNMYVTCDELAAPLMRSQAPDVLSANPLLVVEQYGIQRMKDVICVLVAGGLGERLGYHGIKVSLPTETATMKCFLEGYLQFFATYGRGGHNGAAPNCKTPTGQKEMNPFIIMTSEDTHKLTIQLLKKHNCFGYNSDFIYIIKQEMVPCISDEKSHITCKLARNDKGEITDVELPMKPHGHGDVHQLLFQLHDDNALTATVATNKRNNNPDEIDDITLSLGIHPRDVKGDRLLDRWLGLTKDKNKWMGGNYDPYRFISFIQDTNAMAPATLIYAAAAMDLSKVTAGDPYPGVQMLFGCCPRRPNQAIGTFCKQTVHISQSNSKRKTTMTRVGNLEANIFAVVRDKILKNSGNALSKKLIQGIDNEGNSYFPGSINTLLINLNSYSAALHREGGKVPEFINPKYNPGGVPGTRVFAKPSRLESLMQDIGFVINNMFNERARAERDRLESKISYVAPGQESKLPKTAESYTADHLIGCIIFGRETFEPSKNQIIAALKNEHTYRAVNISLPQSLELKQSADAKSFSNFEQELVVATDPAAGCATCEECYLNFLRDRFIRMAPLATQCAGKLAITGCPLTNYSTPVSAEMMPQMKISSNPATTVFYNRSVDSTSVISAAGGNTLPINLFPIIVYDCAFGVALSTLARRFINLGNNQRIRISKRSVLIINGPVRIDSLDLDGTLIIEASLDPKGPTKDIIVSDCVVRNRGWEALSLDQYKEAFPKEEITEIDELRGYKIARYESAFFDATKKAEKLIYISGKL